MKWLDGETAAILVWVGTVIAFTAILCVAIVRI